MTFEQKIIAIYLHYINGMGAPAVALALNATTDSVYAILGRAKLHFGMTDHTPKTNSSPKKGGHRKTPYPRAEVEKVVAVLKRDVSIRMAGEELKMSKGKIWRLKQQAVKEGLL